LPNNLSCGRGFIKKGIEMRGVDWVKRVVSPKTCGSRHTETPENAFAEQGLHGLAHKVISCAIEKTLENTSISSLI
jgi:hypothetical protein